MLGKKVCASTNDINVSTFDDLPTDTVTSISWMPHKTQRSFACSSWDSKIRIYDVHLQDQQSKLILKGGFEVEEPCLSVAWNDDNTSQMFAGCIDGTVKMLEIQTSKSMNVGKHDAAVKSLYYIQPGKMVMSLSHDKTARVWDLRQEKAVVVINLGYKAYCSDYMFPNVVVGLDDERMAILDLNQLQHSPQQIADTFDYPMGKGSQLTTVAFTSDGAGFGVGLHDGRSHISRFERVSGRIKLDSLLTWKQTRYDNIPTNKQFLYPVHDIGFSSTRKDFVFTAGGDGWIRFWDCNKRERLTSLDFLGVPVTKVKMSPDSELMAYALGYDWSSGISGHLTFNTKICVHQITEKDHITHY